MGHMILPCIEFEKFLDCLTKRPYHFIFLPAVEEWGTLVSSQPHMHVFCFLMGGLLVRKLLLIVVLICILLITREVKYLSLGLLLFSKN